MRSEEDKNRTTDRTDNTDKSDDRAIQYAFLPQF
jgi:hypothetical protein